jgi:hypothetical protein
MNRDEIRIGETYYFFDFDTAHVEFLKVIAVDPNKGSFHVEDGFITRYPKEGNTFRILKVSRIFRSYGAALKKVTGANLLGRYVVESVFENGNHGTLGHYATGQNQWAHSIWKSVYRRK